MALCILTAAIIAVVSMWFDFLFLRYMRVLWYLMLLLAWHVHRTLWSLMLLLTLGMYWAQFLVLLMLLAFDVYWMLFLLLMVFLVMLLVVLLVVLVVVLLMLLLSCAFFTVIINLVATRGAGTVFIFIATGGSRSRN